jgi:hypothetical protein
MFWDMFFQNVCKVLHGKIVLFMSISLSGVRSGDANPVIKLVIVGLFYSVWICFFQSFSYADQKQLVHNLKSVVCSHLRAANTNPADCNSSSLTAVSSILLVTVASLFLATTAS